MTEPSDPTLGTYAEIPISEIKIGWNPRKHFDEAALRDLAASIKADGVLQPVRVRANGKGDGYELVYGERRVRAAKLAGLAVVPAMVRDMTDQEALEAKIAENDQRADVHPLEQAEAYKRVSGALTIAQIAARVGRSPTYVAQRLRLASLCPAARKAYIDGLLDFTGAVAIARLPHAKEQEEFTVHVVHVGGMAGDQAQREIERKYMRRLAEAHFDAADAQLVPDAGACTTCPKRTGAQRELFGDVGKEDRCTFAACWQAKERASWAAAAKAHEAKGGKVSSNPADAYGMPLLTAKCPDDKRGRTYKQILGKQATVSAVLVRDDQGSAQLVVDPRAIAPALKAAGVRPAAAPADRYAAEEAKRKAKQRASHDRQHALLAAIAGAAADAKFAVLIEALLPVLLVDADRTHRVAKTLGLKAKGKTGAQLLAAYAKEGPINRVGALAALVAADSFQRYADAPPARLVACAKALGINPSAVYKKAGGK